jgi:hypothetical protein
LVHTNLVVGHVDHHERQEAEEEAAKDYEHHAGESQVIPSLVLLRRALLARLFIHRFHHRNIGLMLFRSVVATTRSGAEIQMKPIFKFPAKI